MASCRIAWLMDPPRLPPLPPFRPSGGAFGPVAADVPASHCAISDRVAAREGFYGWIFMGACLSPCAPGGRFVAYQIGDRLPPFAMAIFSRSDTVPFGRVGARSMTRARVQRCDRGRGRSIRPSRGAPQATLLLPLLA